jgi:hypothetical protein
MAVISVRDFAKARHLDWSHGIKADVRAWIGVTPPYSLRSIIANPTPPLIVSFKMTPPELPPITAVSAAKITSGDLVTLEWEVDTFGATKPDIWIHSTDNTGTSGFVLNPAPAKYQLTDRPVYVPSSPWGYSDYLYQLLACKIRCDIKYQRVFVYPGTVTPPLMADLFVQTSSYNPSLVHENEAFTVYFTFCNAGGAAAGPFKIRIERDGGEDSVEYQIAGLTPAACDTVSWDIGGLTGSDHYFYAYLDPENAVTETTKANNIGYLGIILN